MALAVLAALLLFAAPVSAQNWFADTFSLRLGPKWSAGHGSPEGVVTAPVGAFYSDVDAGGLIWRKATGAGNTGWVNVSSGGDADTLDTLHAASFARVDAANVFGVFNQTFDTNTLFVDATNHRVGIGRTDPAYAFDVNGVGRFTNSLYTSGGIINAGAKIQTSQAIQGTGSWLDVYMNTADGTDNHAARIGGGGDVSTDRGALFSFFGNEYVAQPGTAQFDTGDVANAALRFKFRNSEKLTIDVSGATFNANILLNGGLHVGGTSDPGDNNLLVDGKATIGTTAEGYVRFRVGGDFASDGSSNVAYRDHFFGTLTGAAGDTSQMFRTVFAGAIVTQAAAETITQVAGLYIGEPNITKNVTSISTAATVMIEGAPTEGDYNYALLVGAGLSYFGGDATVAPGYALETSYTSGWAGAGYHLDYNDTYATQSFLEIDRLSVRGIMSVYELLIHQVRATNGSVYIANTGKVKDLTDNGGGSYNIETETNHGFAEHDLIRAQRFTGTGVYQSDMTITSVVSVTEFVATLRGGYTVPAAGMEYVRLGNTTDADRQGSIYLTADDANAPYINILSGVAAWADWGSSAKTRGRIGNLNGSYGYGSNIYGVAFGDPAAAWFTIDPTEGLRIGHNVTTFAQITAAGAASFTGSVTVAGSDVATITHAAGGNTVGLDTAGANIFYAGPTGAPTFFVTPAGVATMTGATIQNVAAGARIVLDPTSLRAIDAGANTLVTLDGTGLTVGYSTTGGYQAAAAYRYGTMAGEPGAFGMSGTVLANNNKEINLNAVVDFDAGPDDADATILLTASGQHKTAGGVETPYTASLKLWGDSGASLGKAVLTADTITLTGTVDGANNLALLNAVNTAASFTISHTGGASFILDDTDSLDSTAVIYQASSVTKWRAGMHSATLAYRVYNEVTGKNALSIASATDAVTLAGLLTVSGFGTHAFSAGAAGSNILKVENTTSGAANTAYVSIVAGTSAAYLETFSQDFTPAGPYQASGFALEGAGAGGISIIPTNAAGDLRLYSRNVLAATFGVAQAAVFAGSVAIGGGAAIASSNDLVQTARQVNGHALSADVTVTPADLSLVIGTNTQAWNAKLDSIAALASAAGWLHNDGAGAFAYSTPSKGDVGLGNVENTALSTWAGNAYLSLGWSQVSKSGANVSDLSNDAGYLTSQAGGSNDSVSNCSSVNITLADGHTTALSCTVPAAAFALISDLAALQAEVAALKIVVSQLLAGGVK